MCRNETKRNSPPDAYEQDAWKKNKIIIGIDEAGRGCLAGPVVAGAVALLCNQTHPLLQDSKKLSAQQRNTAYQWIITHAHYAVGVVPAEKIDATNILLATKEAMSCALRLLCAQINTADVTLVLSDAVRLAETAGLPHEAHYYGEDLSISIAAASIIAKETRDRSMERHAHYFPSFAFAKHKGYGTVQHQQEIATGHASLIHRMTFAPFKKIKEEDGQQISLFW